jgi:tetratricopeptide (TPR) repeat protein
MPKKVKKPVHVEKITKKVEAKKIEPKKEPKAKVFEPIKQPKPEVKIVVEKKEEPIYDTIKLSVNVNVPSKMQKKEEVKKEEIKTQKVEIKEAKSQKRLNFKVKEVKSEDALLERFKVAGDFDSAMGLANLYFEKRNFEKSIYWSKKASKLSSGDESAWIIYAKSKDSLGKTDDAIKALQLYLEYFSSDSIEKLLKYYRDKK